MIKKLLLPKNMALLNVILGLYVCIFFGTGSNIEKDISMTLIIVLFIFNIYSCVKIKNPCILKNIYKMAIINTVLVLFSNVLNYATFLFVFFIIYLGISILLIKPNIIKSFTDRSRK